ncbi:inverse autotransporter beta domain-containing protein, partial [Aeromonas jandaei]|uniref:inverse autotransporter beta domain-containing protein n=1 Tax=Aeromonas jandaei TaxID=650 RepID=UPI003D1F02D5
MSVFYKGRYKERTRTRSANFFVWLNIALQFFYPVAISFSSTVHASLEKESKAVAVLQAPDNSALPDLGTSKSVESDAKEDGFASQAALVVSELGNVISNENAGEAGKERATSFGVSVANSAVNKWLQQFGTASFSIDANGSGSFDFLLPVFDSQDWVVYSQLGSRTDDERSYMNFGVGVRYFMPGLMLGGNSFYDYDFLGGNRRFGIGVEAWKDYLKLAANGYFKLSDWQQSPLDSMVDYNERPADGFDLRLKAYLPSYPNIGGELSFEKYYGNEVALWSIDGRSKDPSGASYALEYTPFPMLKLGVGQKYSEGERDLLAKASLEYKLGVPLSKQLDSNSVAHNRTLMGSRLDLVDRNHAIVMEYEKQKLIAVNLSANGSAVPGGSVTITASVDAKYGLGKVSWDAAALIADGGEIIPQGDTSLVVKLPPLSANRSATPPSYIVGAVAIDKRGNSSERATYTIYMEYSDELKPEISAISLSSPVALANGTDEIHVNVTVTKDGIPIEGEEVTLAFVGVKGRELGTLDAGITDSGGQVSKALTSTLAGSAEMTVLLPSHDVSASEIVTFIAEVDTATLAEELTVTANNAVANGVATNAVSAVVTDANGNPVSGVAVAFAATNGAELAAQSVT